MRRTRIRVGDTVNFTAGPDEHFTARVVQDCGDTGWNRQQRVRVRLDASERATPREFEMQAGELMVVQRAW